MSWCGGGEIRPDARGGVAGLGDPRVHLVPGQLAALPRLGPLGHLDLQVVGVDQVLAGHPEPAAGHLLDRGPAQVPVGVGHGTAAGPRRPPRCWTCRRAGSSRWPGSRAPRRRWSRRTWRRWRTGARWPETGSTSSSGTGGRCRGGVHAADAQQPAQRHQPGRGVVHQPGVLLEDLVPAAAGGVLQLEHRLRVEQVRLAVAAPLVLAAGLQPLVGQARAAPRRRTRGRGGGPPRRPARRTRPRRAGTWCR